MSAIPSRPRGAIAVAPFEPSAAAKVASWVAGDEEFWMLSPESEPPATAERVLAWAAPNHRQWMFSHAPGGAPFGYGELNDMPGRPEQKWIGHLLLHPNVRRRALGARCVRRLMEMAFDELVAEQVLLVVLPSNEPAVRCYARAGLEPQGEEWKRQPRLARPYRLLRMGITRERFLRTRDQFAALDS